MLINNQQEILLKIVFRIEYLVLNIYHYYYNRNFFKMNVHLKLI